MLESADLVAFVPTTDMERAAAFYGDVLGLAVVESSPYAVVVRSGRTTLRVTKVHELAPQPFTVLGWEVADIGATLEGLAARGVAALRFAGLDQDARGVWTAPGGGLIAWFNDPDGNVLSVSQLG